MKLSKAKEIIFELVKHDDMPAIMLWGPPGVGKSMCIKQCADELGWKMIDLRLAQMNPVDIRGIPVADRENGRAQWYPPAEFPDEKRDGKHGILFLDEIANAPRDVQTAALQLVLDRRLGGYCLPDGWRVIAAGNRVFDRAGSYQMASSLANRFIHLPICSSMPPLEVSKESVDVNLEDWKSWAYGVGVQEEIIGFLNYRQNLLWASTGQVAFATPRTWEFVSKIMSVFSSIDKAKEAVAGCIGDGPAAEFLAFCRVREQMPDPDAILKGEDVPAPERPDVGYALCGALVARLLKLAKKKDQLAKAIENLFGWLPKLPKELQVLLLKDAGNAGLMTQIAMVKGFKEWSVENSAVFVAA